MLVIANPRSGESRGEKVFKKTEKLLGNRNIKFQSKLTDSINHARELAQWGVRKGFEKIVVIGGDGTINEVAQSLVNTEVKLGIIPAGIANDFAESLDLPKNVLGAVDLACSGASLRIDVGKVLFSQHNRYFVNVLGIGFDARVAQSVQTNRHHEGLTDFALNAVKEITSFEEKRVSVSGWDYSVPTLMLGVANGRREGKYFKIAPHASLTDGKLDFFLVDPLSIIKRIECLLKAPLGLHETMPEVHFEKVKELGVDLPRHWFAHVDGEPIDLEKEARIKVVPQSLEVISNLQPEYSLEKSQREIEEPLGVTT